MLSRCAAPAMQNCTTSAESSLKATMASSSIAWWCRPSFVTSKICDLSKRETPDLTKTEQKRIARQNKLIEDHLELARKIATTAFRKLPKHPFKDMLSAAHLGLVDAARRFDPRKYPGVPFECYARVRINGSILDAHRALHKTVYVNEFPPDPVDEADYFKPAADQMLAKSMASVLGRLTDDERTIIHLRYALDLTMAAIGTRMGISNCLVSQHHRAAIEKMREPALRLTESPCRPRSRPEPDPAAKPTCRSRTIPD